MYRRGGKELTLPVGGASGADSRLLSGPGMQGREKKRRGEGESWGSRGGGGVERQESKARGH